MFTISILGVSNISLAQTANFQGLGDLPGGDFESDAYAVSADGLTVVGRGCPTPLGAHYVDYEAFRCTPGSDMEGLGHIPPGPGGTYPYQRNSEATSASHNGSTIVGWCKVPITMPTQSGGWTGFRWDEINEIQPLTWFTPIDGWMEDKGQFVISDDASTIVVHALRWKETNPATGEGDLLVLSDLLEFPGGTHYSCANDVSADGSIIVGKAAYAMLMNPREPTEYYYQAYRWSDKNENGQDDPGELQGLGTLKEQEFPFSPESVANACTPDGSVIVGWSDSDDGSQAFLWTLTDPDTGDGEMIGLGILNGHTSSIALDVSADGSVVIGKNYNYTPFPFPTITDEIAFIWDEFNGMRDLKVVLESEYGLDLTGWTLTSASGISADGLTIVGSGINPDGNPEAWIVTIPEPSCLVLFSFAGLCLARRRKTLRTFKNSR